MANHFENRSQDSRMAIAEALLEILGDDNVEDWHRWQRLQDAKKEPRIWDKKAA